MPNFKDGFEPEFMENIILVVRFNNKNILKTIFLNRNGHKPRKCGLVCVYGMSSSQTMNYHKHLRAK